MSEIKPITGKYTKVKLADLYLQYIPVITSMKIWEHDMSLVNSPHVELARLLLMYGKDWDAVKDCRYVQDRRHRFKCGVVKWTDKYIREHVFGSRYKILKSLRKRGFDKKLSRNEPIAILEEPLWSSRFAFKPDWLKGMEIYHGGRRCSAAFALGWEEIPAIMVN